jgi:hypothetical protein
MAVFAFFHDKPFLENILHQNYRADLTTILQEDSSLDYDRTSKMDANAEHTFRFAIVIVIVQNYSFLLHVWYLQTTQRQSWL